MGFLTSLSSMVQGGGAAKPPTMGKLQDNMAYGAGDVKNFGKGTREIYDKYRQNNPYGKGYHDYVRTEAEGAISGEEKAGQRDIEESRQKYGGDVLAQRRKQALRRAGMGARSDARRRAFMQFLEARVGLDQNLMQFGHGAGMEAGQQYVDTAFQRHSAKSQQYQSRFEAGQSWMDRAGMGVSGAARTG